MRRVLSFVLDMWKKWGLNTLGPSPGSQVWKAAHVRQSDWLYSPCSSIRCLYVQNVSKGWKWPEGRWGGGSWKEGKVTTQRTCMNDPWTWTTVWELTVGAGGGLGGGGQSKKNWETVIEWQYKMILQKSNQSNIAFVPIRKVSISVQLFSPIFGIG